jgi:hypothetical protein
VACFRMAKNWPVRKSKNGRKNGEGERSIAVGAPALQLSTAPRLFLPNSAWAVSSVRPECAAIANLSGDAQMSKWQEPTRKDIS